MRKATLFFSIASFVTSVATLGVIGFGVRKLNADIQAVHKRANDSVENLKAAVNSITL